MSNTIAELLVMVGADISGMQRGLRQVGRDVRTTEGGLGRLGAGMQRLGRSASIGGAILAGALGAATLQAIHFDTAMTNARSVLGLTADEMAGINAEVLRIGSESVAGPQAAAEAYYDIVSGVQDATTHMAILDAAIATSEAGAANLQATTNGLVSVMNAYGGGVDDAEHYSDVFTRTVGVGVGTMDEFVAALGPVAGIAAQVGVSFDEIGGAAALMTTRGFSAAQAGTRIQAAITALIKPNEEMSAALAEMGFQSGEAAIQQLGLQGALEALRDAVGGSTDKMAGALGTTEALGAALALTAEDAGDFMDAFAEGVDGATEAARRIQLEGVQNQFALLRSQVSGLAITVGSALLPVLVDIAKKATPIVEQIAEWIQNNPELTGQLLVIAGAGIALGPVLGVVGGALKGISAIVPLVTGGFNLLKGALGLLLSPVGLIAAGFLGIMAVGGTLDDFLSDVGEAFNGMKGGVEDVAGGIQKLVEGDTEGGLEQIGNGIKTIVENAAKIPISLIENLAIGLGNILGIDVKGGIQAWQGVGDNLKTIFDEVKTNIETGVQAKIDEFTTTLTNLWSTVEGPVDALVTGFEDAFNWIKNNIIQPVIDTINSIVGAVQTAVNGILGLPTGEEIVARTVPSGGSGSWSSGGSSWSGGGFSGGGGTSGPNSVFRAAGGPVTAGGAYIVGEEGPELFVPSRSGRIVPNGASAGGDTYILNAYGSSPYGLLRDLDRAARMRGK